MDLTNFSDLTVKITKLNKFFLDGIKFDLYRNDICDITPMQALLLKNIYESSGTITMLKKHGYHLGKNHSYNFKALLDQGYITKKHNTYDARGVTLSLTKEGERILGVINSWFMHHNETLMKLVKNDNFIPQTSNMIDKLLNVFDIK